MLAIIDRDVHYTYMKSQEACPQPSVPPLRNNNPSWMARGACSEADDPNIFFPEKGYSAEAREKAMKYCGRCAVRNECLGYALTHDESGIWGGKTKKERTTLINRQRRYDQSQEAV